MLNHQTSPYFSVPVNNEKNGRPITKQEQPKQGMLERWLDLGKTERFPEIVMITPDRARALLKLNTHNRPIIKAAVDQYAEIMRRGKWRLTIEAIGITKEGILLNGQHRLEAVCVANVSVPFTIWFGCDPDEFEIIDQGRKRMAKTLVDLAGYSYPSQRASAAKVLLTLDGWSSTTPPAEFVAEKVEQLGHALDRAVYWGTCMRHVTTPTASVVAYYTIQAAGVPNKDVDDFFGSLASGELMSPVVSRLRDDLTIGVLSKNSQGSSSMTIKRAAAIISTWNAYRKGLKTVRLRWAHSSSLPDVVVAVGKGGRS